MINAEAVCELLRALAARYAWLPLTLVLDNARYQRCALVRQLAKELRIQSIFLPAYSPNLNLIERLWKFVKKEVLSCRYYETSPGSRQHRGASMVDEHKSSIKLF